MLLFVFGCVCFSSAPSSPPAPPPLPLCFPPSPPHAPSAQAIGEPPLFLAASVFFALKDAVYAARADAAAAEPPRPAPATDAAAATAAVVAAANGARPPPRVPHVRLDCPASVERLRVACPDEYLERVGRANGGREVPAPDLAL